MHRKLDIIIIFRGLVISICETLTSLMLFYDISLQISRHPNTFHLLISGKVVVWIHQVKIIPISKDILILAHSTGQIPKLALIGALKHPNI